MAFEPATRGPIFGRIALLGVKGAMNTYAALVFGSFLARMMGKSLAVIDSGGGRYTDKYTDLFSFDRELLVDHSPEGFIKAITEANRSGKYGCLVIANVSDEWGFITQEKSKFGDWKTLTPRHEKFMDSIFNCNMHVIVVADARTKHDQRPMMKDGKPVLENGRPKQEVINLGVQAIQRVGTESRFDLSGLMDAYHNLSIRKTECPALPTGTVIKEPGDEVARLLHDFFTFGSRPDDITKKRMRQFYMLIEYAEDHGVYGDRLRQLGQQVCGKPDPRFWTLSDIVLLKEGIDRLTNPAQDVQKDAAKGS